MQRVSLVYKTPDGPVHSAGALPGVLSFDLSGSGAIEIQITVKKPGAEFVPAEACQTLRLDQVSDGAMAPYTSLVHDVFAGDRSLFTSAPGLRAAFAAFAPFAPFAPLQR